MMNEASALMPTSCVMRIASFTLARFDFFFTRSRISWLPLSTPKQIAWQPAFAIVSTISGLIVSTRENAFQRMPVLRRTSSPHTARKCAR